MRTIHTPPSLQTTLAHKKKQTKRFSRHTFELTFLIIGAGLVALCAFCFAQLADLALEINAWLVTQVGWLIWGILPIGMTIIVYLTHKYAPYTTGSGIPQVIAAIHLPYSSYKTRLVILKETILKIPLTFLGMLCGASIGREGPSVQVGAAVMVAWGKWCKKHNYAFRGLEENNLLAIGAAGGLAAAFNAPLAGVIFAIEELGRGKALRWERHILIGVVASGMFLIAIQGNSPYFPTVPHHSHFPNPLLWISICALICGISGGLFARALSKGITGFLPHKLHKLPTQHPLIIAALCGLLLAYIGTHYQGQTYGTGYQLVAKSIKGDPNLHYGSLAFGKWMSTILSYWAGIPGGIFTPCLTIGAIIGQSLAELAHFNIPPDILVLLGMTAFLAATTQSPLTSSVVVMEMSSTQNLLFWMLVCSITASTIARQFCPKPFYHFAAQRFIKHIQEQQKQAYEDMIHEMHTRETTQHPTKQSEQTK